MIKSTYDPYLFFRFELLDIVEIQTNDTLILADYKFASIKIEAIKLA